MPSIFDGTREGIPYEHPNNDYNQWCREIGFPSFGSVVTLPMENLSEALKWCSGYDGNADQWCEWDDGYRRNATSSNTKDTKPNKINRLACSMGSTCTIEYILVSK